MNKTTTPIPSEDGVSETSFNRLPAYSRSLLKIEVPVTVTLANTTKSIGSIVGMVPGTIIQFEKMCDDTLSLEVSGPRVAEGETVKVGDKFGLRITSIVLPEERFSAVTGMKSPAESPESSPNEQLEPAASQ